MPTRTSMSVLALVAGITLARIPAVAGIPEMRFRPAAASGNVVCMPGEGACGETQIILSDGGVTVTLFLQMSHWDTADGGHPGDSDYWLGALTGTVDHRTYEGGRPENPGTLAWFDLLPVGQPDMGFEGAFQALKVCHGPPYTPAEAQLLTKCSSPADCQVGELCLDRWDYIFYDLDSTATTSTSTLDYSWSAASTDCREDPRDGSRFYFGTLILEVPVGARGTYNVDLNHDVNRTWWCPCSSCLLTGFVMTPAQITIASGRCCSGLGIGTSVCEDDLTQSECDTRPGPRVFTEFEHCSGDGVNDCNDNGVPDDCESDSDGDGVIDECEGCPDDPNKTEPGVCGCGVDDDPDADGDGIPDCIDECPGVDDAVFAPDCIDVIPTVSGWGVLVTMLLLLVGGKLSGRRVAAG